MSAATAEPSIQEKPLYIRIPQPLHDYLDGLKDITGISKSDAVTLFLLLARRFIDSKTLLEVYDDYMIRGEEGLEIQSLFQQLNTPTNI